MKFSSKGTPSFEHLVTYKNLTIDLTSFYIHVNEPHEIIRWIEGESVTMEQPR